MYCTERYYLESVVLHHKSVVLYLIYVGSSAKANRCRSILKGYQIIVNSYVAQTVENVSYM